jgi:hypothetical protein
VVAKILFRVYCGSCPFFNLLADGFQFLFSHFCMPLQFKGSLIWRIVGGGSSCRTIEHNT